MLKAVRITARLSYSHFTFLLIRPFRFPFHPTQLWDLTAGKLISEFKDHSGPITSLEFHPSEFLLATGSADRCDLFFTQIAVAKQCKVATPIAALRRKMGTQILPQALTRRRKSAKQVTRSTEFARPHNPSYLFFPNQDCSFLGLGAIQVCQCVVARGLCCSLHQL